MCAIFSSCKESRKYAFLSVVLLLPGLPLCNHLEIHTTAERDESYDGHDPIQSADHIENILKSPIYATANYWQNKPTIKQTYTYLLNPLIEDADLNAVRHFKQGEFRPYDSFGWERLGVPPPWDSNFARSSTYDLYRHSLDWVAPLIRDWKVNNDAESLQLTKQIIRDWIHKNSEPPGKSSYAWDDHSAAYRLRLMCWFWELWRTSDEFEWPFARLLLASMYQHGLYLADLNHYPEGSNHALMVTGCLYGLAITIPELRHAEQWKNICDQRLSDFLRINFDPSGFNLEQSPYYHWFVIHKIGNIIRFLHNNDYAIPDHICDFVQQIISTWRWLLRSDLTTPLVGDSDSHIYTDWKRTIRNNYGKNTNVEPLPDTLLNPRDDQAGLLISPSVGYAIFTSYNLSAEKSITDTHILFRCNAHPFSSHCHPDALSFTLFGIGRDWLVDSGKYNYERSDPYRQYMTSSRAHNVVLVDDKDFGFHHVEIRDSWRNETGDYIEVAHTLSQAMHVRKMEFIPPHTLRITDRLTSTDLKPHTYTQLFHAAPALQVKIVSNTKAVLKNQQGDQCILEQAGQLGEWHVVKGQTEPHYQGWYSAEFNEVQASPVLIYRSTRPLMHVGFITTIQLQATP